MKAVVQRREAAAAFDFKTEGKVLVSPGWLAVYGKDARVQSSDAGDGVRVELLVPGAQNREMDPVLVTLDPGEEMDEQPFHEGEEFGYVLLGKVQLKLDAKVYTIKKDECFYFASDKRHAVKNIGKGPAKILWVVTPPTFYY